MKKGHRLFIFYPQRCFGCYGCVAACVNVNNTPAGLLWRSLHKLPPRDGDHRTFYLSVSCNHCENPPCVNGCPSNALEKKDEDGVVIHQKEKCIGCRYCTMACPYDALKWDEQSGVVGKCHFCYQRLEQGREPACVETCFAGALEQKVLILGNVPPDYEQETPGFVHIESIGPSIRFIKTLTASGDVEESNE